MSDWRSRLPYDPLSCLTKTESKAVAFFVSRDLLDEEVGPVRRLWDLPPAKKVLAKQRVDGSWKYHRNKAFMQRVYDHLETYRMMGELVEKYEFDRRHEAIARAVEFQFSCQTKEGDLRGIYGPQFSPNYTAAYLERIVKAGYQDDDRVDLAFRWLLSVRQDDGFWAIPMRTAGISWRQAIEMDEPIRPVRSKPSSHLATGIVIRAFAAHPRWRKSKEAKATARWLLDRFFKSDSYADRRTPAYWTKFSFPFWWTDILSSLDAISRIDPDIRHPNVERALEWLASKQKSNGSFGPKLLMGANEPALDDWIALSICRVFKRLEAQ